MSRHFTVKDFITYNNPCFGCGKAVSFKIGFSNTDEMGSAITSYLRPTVGPQFTEIDLKITYNDTIKMYVFHKDNKILTSNQRGMIKYLNNHQLFLSSNCTCHTEIVSDILNLHLVTNNQFVEPTTLHYEKLIVTHNDNVYELHSSFLDKKSTLISYKKDTKPRPSPTTIEMPLIPKYKFKNRDHFLEKMKTYVLFS
jgi:hypothetical protein